MRKKILALLLVIPLIFMFTIFSASTVASIIVPVPVNEITIKNASQNGVVYFDLATYKNDFKLGVEVKPIQANNKNFSINCVPSDLVYFDSNNILKLKQAGTTKVTVKSKDGNFADSITIVVFSSIATGMELELVSNDFSLTKVNNNPNYNYTVQLYSGEYNLNAYIIPKGVVADIAWSTDDNTIVDINLVGRFVAMTKGSAIVTAKSIGIGGEIVNRVKIEVMHPENNNSGLYLFSANATKGGSNLVSVTALNEDSEVKLLMESLAETVPNLQRGQGEQEPLGYKYISSVAVVPYGVAKAENGFAKYEVTLKLNTEKLAEDNCSSFEVNLFDKNVTSSVKPRVGIKINLSAFSFNILTSMQKENSATLNQLKGITQTYFAIANIKDDSITYKWSVSDQQILSISSSTLAKATITAKGVGKANVVAKAYLNNVEVASLTQEINITDNLVDIQFVDKVGKDGISELLTVGDTNLIDSNYYVIAQELKLQSLRQGEASTGGLDDINVFSSDESIATVTYQNGKVKLVINANGIVTVTAKWAYNEQYGKDIKTSITVRCVKYGVNIDSYNALVKAAKENKQIVLNSSIMLGEQGLTAEQVKSKGYVTAMQTTANCNYLKNVNSKLEVGKKLPTTVLYAIRFSNNVYGNGYQLNAEYIANCKDSTGNNRLFNGPLNLVNLMGAASVKAQDNIAFLVDGDNILLDNITLKNCLDTSILASGKVDLTLLDNVGTTLEVMSNARITNTRLLNGRTVLRAFGGNRGGQNTSVNSIDEVDTNLERIKVNVESCIIGYAREFVIKVGTNKILKATKDNYEPLLYGSSNKPATDKEFYDRYVLTDLTIKDSILFNSGLFAIGVESNFSGEILTGDIENFKTKVGEALNGLPELIEELIGQMKEDWKDIGGTSFASVVNIVGSTRLYNWKLVEDINSSSLIDVNSSNEMIGNMLTLDISTMISEMAKKPAYRDIITTYESKQYAHCGVMFYGGGRNYSKLGTGLSTEKIYTNYAINLSLLAEGRKIKDESGNWDFLFLQGEFMPFAAGRQDFKFVMYNSNDFNDTYFNQDYDITPVR